VSPKETENMSWLKELERKVGKVALAEKAPKPAAKRDDPRTKVVTTLANNIQLLADPSFRIEKRGKQISPRQCFALGSGDHAEIWIPYGGRPLDLWNGKTCVRVPKQHLKETLEALLSACHAGEFDQAITERRAAIRMRLKGDSPKSN
jgi:hypothetical protein